ncbi:MAG: DUF1640 domain-containing protein [Rhodospirillaceae bacterium]|nr:DUF1640 domain-containing protein [Rhodospirillaceae bacterium]MYF86734.1 DUF1640 domain-containing protein [Rhodospirillaceae bacterium]MYH37151.1 DUF1640 domain-containing protein [Rhodospirillaceae bacterium]MYK13525.1 DUF1640 domain-containing protein [Rhodospirillaceae bacterium]
MTEAIAFDTHRFVKRLTESGFTERQAETLAEEHVALLNANLAAKVDVAALKSDIVQVVAALKTDIAQVVATLKTDIAQVEATLKADIAQVEASLKTDIAQVGARIEAVKADLLKWMFGALIAQGGLIVALVKLL